MNATTYTDLLIIGTGIAGLSLARNIAQKNKDVQITIISKASLEECNTNYAQGGIAVVYDFIKDSFQQHINDTIKAGKGLNNPKVVEHVITEAPNRLKELLDWGVELDKNTFGSLDLGLEGGHSQNRIVHHKDKTGQEIESKLIRGVLEYSNITILSSFFVTDLLTNNNTCYGVVGYNNKNQSTTIKAAQTVLATGGSGQVFEVTSNPAVSTGDGIAMAIRAGAKITNMQYIQFHPTALYEPNKQTAFLISEAIRGFGAHIVNANQERFLFYYHPDGELATRDVVSAAITQQIKFEKVSNMWLDLRHLNQDELKTKFAKIYTYCNDSGYDTRVDLLPILPAAHYQCGGIEVDKFGATSIDNLFAIGECSQTGLHGANRLASNSLLEALVYAFDASKQLTKKRSSKESVYESIEFPSLKYKYINNSEILKFRELVKQSMTFEIILNKTTAKITYQKVVEYKRRFLKKFKNYNYNALACETYNLIVVAESILLDRLELKEFTPNTKQNVTNF